MPHDTTLLSETHPPRSQDNEPVVRHFRQIVMWPLHIQSRDPAAGALGYHRILERLSKNGVWKAVEDEFGADEAEFQERHYREFVSFLPHVQHFLYGDAAAADKARRPGDAPVRIYRRTDITAARITVEAGDPPIVCQVAHTDLYFFYDVDAVILTCEISADNVPMSVAKVLAHRFGRAYPSGWRDNGDPLHCPILVEWLGADGSVIAASDYTDRDRYLRFVGRNRAACVARHWEYMLSPLVSRATDSAKSALTFREIEYYRMPVMLYLVVDDVGALTQGDKMSLTLATTISGQTDLPFSEDFVQKFDGDHVYQRRYAGGLDAPDVNTRFLTSGEAFTVVASGPESQLLCNERGLLGQFRHQYFLIFLIAHFHKAALLMISDRIVASIKALDPSKGDSIRRFRDETFTLQETFLRFSQRYLFNEVSGQSHLRDLFALIRRHLHVDALHAEVRSELFDMVQYLDSNALRRQSAAIYRLTVVTIIGLVGTIATGFLGMNLLAEADQPLWIKAAYFFGVTAVVLGLTMLTIVYSRPLANFIERLSGDTQHRRG